MLDNFRIMIADYSDDTKNVNLFICFFFTFLIVLIK